MLQYFQMSFLILGIGIRKREKIVDSKECINKKQTDILKAFCAIVVMLGHFAASMDGFLMNILNRGGVLGVGIFFFISGFGLMEGMKRNPCYLEGFLARRCKTLLIPLFISHGSMLGIRIAMKLIKFSDLFSIKEVLRLVNWYIYVIAFFYLLFYFVYKFCPKLKGTIIITFIIVLMNFFLYFIDFNRLFYGGNVCFIVGLWLSLFEKEIFSLFKNNYAATCFFSILALCIGVFAFLKMGYANFWGDFLGRNISSLAVVFLMILFLMKFEWHNRILSWLSNFYYEIYLVHAYVLCIFEEQGKYIYNNSYINYFMGLILSIGLAVILHYISGLIQNLQKKK